MCRNKEIRACVPVRRVCIFYRVYISVYVTHTPWTLCLHNHKRQGMTHFRV